MFENIQYSNDFIAYLETLEYDCGHATEIEYKETSMEYDLAHLHADVPSKYEGICHA